MKTTNRIGIVLLILLLLFGICGCGTETDAPPSSVTTFGTMSQMTTAATSTLTDPSESDTAVNVTLDELPAYDGVPFTVVNENMPFFTAAEKDTIVAFETYSPLDTLGRCGVTVACVGKELMPTESRGDISSVKPSGWHNEPYDFVDGRYVYNRCHLLGFQLTGENANERNLITGTRYMNVEGMLPFENMVADYIKETGNHVMLRVTPLYQGNDLVARGVLMEAYSVEDNGDGICYNVFCYNVQPGVTIDYATGYNHADGNGTVDAPDNTTYILNTNSKKIHYPSCGSAQKIADKNRKETTLSLEELTAQGYDPCGNCF